MNNLSCILLGTPNISLQMVLEVAEEKMTLNYPGVGTSLKFLVLKMSHLVTAQVSKMLNELHCSVVIG